MFRKNQKQVVNFNQLLDQMREGEYAKFVLNRVFNYLHSCFEEEHRKFHDKLRGKKDTDIFYEWEYPFNPFGIDDHINKVVELAGYSLNAEDTAIVEQDWKQAVKHNSRAEELKKQEA